MTLKDVYLHFREYLAKPEYKDCDRGIKWLAAAVTEQNPSNKIGEKEWNNNPAIIVPNLCGMTMNAQLPNHVQRILPSDIHQFTGGAIQSTAALNLLVGMISSLAVEHQLSQQEANRNILTGRQNPLVVTMDQA